MADDIFVSNDIELDVDFGEVFIIDQGVVTKVIANKYNPTQTYDVGDYVINVDKLYKCITAIVEPEEFDNTKWENVKLANEVQSLNEIVPTKADKADTYTKTETNTLLSNKADKSNTYTKSEVDTALANKVDNDTLDNYYTKDNVYTKTEVNDNLALKADKADTYTKGDVNDYLALKADKSDTYTKSETDTALNAKADSDSVYDKSETYSKTEVDNKIANLPAPMIMKGTLGTGGTITDLPTASSENEGFTYKVITDGTYAGQVAKTGDVFTSAKPVGSSDYIWLYIPSGDETFTDTWRGIKVNGTEKLGSAISSGEVDFIDGTNTTVTFNSTGNKIKVDVDGYTQAQVDTKLADKANASDVYAKSETYSQAEVDSKLLNKANTSDVYTKQETYTKTEVNTALSEKADTSAVTTALALKADKADTYTKAEVDDKFDEIDPIGTASGTIASFETNYVAPLKTLKCEITAKQDLHGYDHPWADGAGKNKLNYDAWKNVGVNGGTAVYENNGVTITALTNDAYTYWNNDVFPQGARVSINEGETITLSWSETANKSGLIYIFPNGEPNGLVAESNVVAKKISYTATEGVTYVTFRFGVENQGDTIAYKNIQIEKGSQATPYEPYSNICPLVGHSELNLTRCGVNLWEGTKQDNVGVNATTGNLYASTGTFTTDYIKVNASTSYYANPSNWKTWVCFYDANKVYVGYASITNGVFATSATAVFMRISGDMNEISTACINYPATDTTYHAYNGQTFTVAFGQTVYGGVYDKSGRLTITHAIVALDQIPWDYSGGAIFMASIADCALVSDATQVANWNCSCFPIIAQSGHQAGVSGISASNWFNGLTFWNEEGYTQATFEAAIAGQSCVYELATPIVIDVPSISVFAENGTNNVFSDTGDTEVEYTKGSMAKDIKTIIGTTKFADLSDIPNPPTADGNYRLIVTITDGKPAYSWEEITE